jgi:fibronectin type 3 domain-containing protein
MKTTNLCMNSRFLGLLTAAGLMAASGFIGHARAAASSLPAGTVVYYSFDDPNNLGLDDSGNGQDLQSAGGTPQAESNGLFGGALYLDGGSTLGPVSGLLPTGIPTGANPYTVAFFTKAGAGCANGGWIGYGTGGAQNLANNLRLNGYNQVWNYWYANDLGANLPSGSFQDGWHSVVGTWDGTTRTIYIDGIARGSDHPTGLNVGNSSFVVGKTLNDCNLTGWMDELLIADRAFTAQEVAAYHSYGASGLPALPPQPAALTAQAGNARIYLSWTDVGGATGYNVKRSTADGGPYTLVGTATAAHYSDTAVNNGATYYYVVSATNSVGQSADSAQASATPTAPVVPGLPTGTVAYYPFDGSAIDYSGQGNDLKAMVGNPTYTFDALFNEAVYLDGGTTLGPISGLFPTGVPTGNKPYTVAFFTKADSSGCANGGWIGYGTAGGANLANNFRLNGFNSVWNYWYANDLGGSLPTGSFQDGWHSVVGTWDGTTRKIYLDGVLAASNDPGQPNVGTNQFLVGQTLNDCTFTGWMDELLIASRPFNAEEVAAYHAYGAVVQPPQTPTGLTATAGSLRVILTWSGAVGAAGYTVKRSQTDLGPYTVIGTTTAAQYLDTTVVNGGVYYYVVSATNSAGQSDNSTQVSAAPEYSAFPPGTVAYYSFDDTNSLAVDNSGNGNDLQGTSGAPQADPNGVFAGALYLDGSTTLGTASGLFPTGMPSGASPYTVAFFTKAATGCGNGGWIGYGTANAANVANNFRMEGYGAMRNYWYANDLLANLASGSFQDGWHSVVGTWDGTTRTLYIDGAIRASDNPTGLNIGTDSFVVGKTLNDCNFTGWMDELLLANRAFLPEEVAAYNNFGASGTPALPAKPTGLTADAGNSRVFLSWSPALGATSYKVKRALTDGGPYTVIGTTTTPSYLDTGLNNGTTYYFVVAAANEVGEVNSAQVNAKPVQPVLPTGIVAYYPFDGSATDDSGNANHLQGTAGTPQYSGSGKFGGSLYLDGNTTLGTVSGLFPTGVPTSNQAYTVALYTKADFGGSGNGGWIGYGTANTVDLANNFRLNGFGGIRNYWYANDLDATLPSGNFQDGWHSVVGTWDGTNRTVYIDGVARATDQPTGLNVGKDSFAIGRTLNDANFRGWLDELLIANRAFTVEEVAAYHLNGGPGGQAPVPSTPTGLVAVPGSAKVFLTWSGSIGATRYNVLRSQKDGGPYTPVGSATAVQFLDGTADNGTTYYYVVAAANSVGESTNSVQVSATPAALSLPQGTVVYYGFDDANNLGADNSGNGQDLQAASGVPQFDSGGIFGGALYLDGNSTLGTVSGLFPTGVPTGPNPYTVALFAKAGSGGCDRGGWIGYGTANAQNVANNFRLNGYNSVWNYWYANDVGASLPKGTFQDGWHSVVGTWDGTTRTIYLDGVARTTDNPTGLNVGSDSFVVGRTLNDCNYIGWMDELLIVNRALTPEEVAAYNLGVFAPGTAEPGPLRITNFDPKSGDVTVAFNTAANHTYVLRYKNSLTDADWTDVGTAVPGTGATVSVTDPGAAAPANGNHQRFYRAFLLQ